MQEEEFEQENSIKHRVTMQEVHESIREYMGDYTDVLKELTLKEYDTFTELLPKVQKTAYFVKGNQSMLRKFKAFFIARCVLERYDYSSMMLKDYVEGISEKSDDELFIAGINRDLVFLYLHKEVSGIGKTDDWMGAAALDRMVNRKREGLITVVLSERDFPQIESSDEIKKIDLGGAWTANKMASALQILKKPKEGKAGNTSKWD